MDPAQDPLYRLHQLQAERLGEVALPYDKFRATLVKKDSTDMNLLVLPPADAKLKSEITSKPLFNLGALCILENVAGAVPPDEILRAVERHARGDWGVFEDAGLNELALHRGSWLLSTYRSSGGIKFWVVTTPDPAMTFVMFRKGDP
jgi:hypothetical protein